MSEAEGDLSPVKRALKLPELVRCRYVDVVIGIEVEDHGTYRAVGLFDEVLDGVTNCLGVGIEEGGIRFHDQDALCRLPVGVPSQIDVYAWRG